MSAQRTPGPFTPDEQAILASDPAALRLLALWHHIRSGSADMSQHDAEYHEGRSCELYDRVHALTGRRPRASIAKQGGST